MKSKIILIADDDQEDRDMLEEIILGIDSETVIHSLSNGHQVQDFLKQCDDKLLPSIIVLDYNMPVITGAELLVKIQAEEKFKPIPVVIMSTSNAQKHVDECMANGANEYFVKPTDFRELKNLAQRILDMAN